MQDRDERRYGQGSGEPASRREDWRSEGQGGSDWAQRDEQRSFDPPYGDASTYGRQGQPGGNASGGGRAGYGERHNRGDLGEGYGGAAYRQLDQGEPTYASEGEYEPARRSAFRDQNGYGDTGWATAQGGYNQPERQYGGMGGYGQGDLSAGGGREGVYGEGAGRAVERDRPRLEPYGGGGRQDVPQHEDFDPDYLDWRRNQLAAYDRDYHHWRTTQARAHDEAYRSWRQSRRDRFHQDFGSWRASRSGADNSSQGGGAGGQTPLRPNPVGAAPISPSTTGGSYTGQSAGGGATSGFFTHELSGATNADLSGETTAGPSGDVGPMGGAASAGITHGSGASAQDLPLGGGDGAASTGSTGMTAAGPLGERADPNIQHITDTGDTLDEDDIGKDRDKDEAGRKTR
jgi:hypothetical protein